MSPGVHCNSREGGGASSRCESGEGRSGKQAQRAEPYFSPLPKKKVVNRICQVSAISDVLRCLWWAGPLEPH